MKIKYITITLLLYFPIFSFSQVELNTIDELKEYIEGEWQLIRHNNGWTGESSYPTDTVDYRVIFERIEDSDSTMLCKGVLNQMTFQESIVSIQYSEDYHWGFDNFPLILESSWLTLFMWDTNITLDSFDVHDASSDGNNLRFMKVNTTSIFEILDRKSTFTIYPNPSSGNIRIDGSGEEALSKVRIYNIQGQFLEEKHFIENHQITLPEGSTQLILELIMMTGEKEVRLVSRM